MMRESIAYPGIQIIQPGLFLDLGSQSVYGTQIWRKASLLYIDKLLAMVLCMFSTIKGDKSTLQQGAQMDK